MTTTTAALLQVRNAYAVLLRMAQTNSRDEALRFLDRAIDALATSDPRQGKWACEHCGGSGIAA